jgi:hypothetical protein
MLKTWGAVSLLIVAAAAAAWMAVPASHAPANAMQTEGITCGTHHCGPNSICCPSCTTGELRCTNGPRCHECAPQ